MDIDAVISKPFTDQAAIGPGARSRLVPLSAALGFLAVGVSMTVDTFLPRHVNAPKGQGFWGVIYAWVGLVWLLGLWRRSVPGRLSPAAAAVLSLLAWVPGGAVMWYAIWAIDQTESGTCVSDTGTSVSCIQGPGALIPWAIFLLIVGIVVSWRMTRRALLVRREADKRERRI